MGPHEDLKRHREAVEFIENYSGEWDRIDEIPELLREDVLSWLRTLQDRYQRLADGYRLLADGAKD